MPYTEYANPAKTIHVGTNELGDVWVNDSRGEEIQVRIHEVRWLAARLLMAAEEGEDDS